MTPLTSACACPDCICTVSESEAVLIDGSTFCSEACASGHKNQEPCHGNGACGCTCNA